MICFIGLVLYIAMTDSGSWDEVAARTPSSTTSGGNRPSFDFDDLVRHSTPGVNDRNVEFDTESRAGRVSEAGSGVTAPSAFLQGSQSGTQVDSSVGKPVTSVFVAPSDIASTFCLGAVGGVNASKFCCRDADSCTTKTHSQSKMRVSPDNLYIWCPGKEDTQAYVRPTLNTSELPDSFELSPWLEARLTLEEWELAFSARFGLDSKLAADKVPTPLFWGSSSTDPPAEKPSNFGTLLSDVRNRLTGSSKSPKASPLSQVPEKAASQPADLEELNKTIGAQGAMITELFQLVNTLSYQLKAQPSSEDLAKIHRDLGSRPSSDGFRSIAVWDVISDLPSFSGVSDLTSRFDHLSRDANQLASAFRSTATNNNRWLQELDTDLKRLSDRMDTLRPASSLRSFSGPGAPSDWQAEASTLRQDISNLRSSMHQVTASDDLGFRLSAVEDDVSDMKQRIVGTNTFTFRNDVFGSANDVLKVLTIETIKKVHVGFFLDMFTALCLCVESFLDGKDFADRVHSARRVETSALDSDMLSTMGHPTPKYLFQAKEGSGSRLVRPEEGFGFRLPNHSAYMGRDSKPIKTEIQDLVNSQVAAVQGIIPAEFDNKAYELARHCLQQTTQHVNFLLDHMSRWHLELTQQCNYSEPESWRFIGMCVRHVMDYLRVPRMDVARVESLDPPAKARVIWAVLQVHIRMDEVIKDNLKAHRVVQTAMANFNMRTRVDKSTVEALDKKVKDAEKTLATFQKEHSALQTDFGKTKQTVNSEIANLKKTKPKG